MKLERWLKEVKPKVRSKLDPHVDEIATLRERGYTQLQITEFLRLNGIETTRENLRFFLEKKVKNKPAKQTATIQTQETRPTKEEAKHNQNKKERKSTSDNTKKEKKQDPYEEFGWFLDPEGKYQ